MLNDLEEVEHQLSTVNISSLVVASYLQLAQLESQSREVQVTQQHRPLLENRQCGDDALVLVAGAGCRKRCGF